MTNRIPLRQFVEHVARRAENMFKKQGGHLSPMYHAVDGAGQDLIFPAPAGSKDESVAIVREILKSAGAVRVAYLDEAWLVDTEQGASSDEIDQIYKAGTSIAKHPKRIEAIIVSAEDANEGLLIARREIIRHGNRAILGRLKIVEMDQSEGRMVGLLPSLGTKH